MHLNTLQLIKVVLNVNVGVEQVFSVGREVHLVEDEVLEGLLQLRLPDEHSSHHPSIAKHHLYILVSFSAAQQQLMVLTQALSIKLTQQHHLGAPTTHSIITNHKHTDTFHTKHFGFEKGMHLYIICVYVLYLNEKIYNMKPLLYQNYYY